ncbi:conserved hypothetical protein [Parafrankia sp. Ea1.12]|uniref:hypothetical protein n=1 Tax=Parafrankia sp. Ea1.12 TaxID=573499 RepID=UPI000DA511DB|nr:hypothetical protein [Parafrankia sp. Ea1.12]SQD94467.1 conserved hypothetical protein [Parafrankia sp. Ea1.12]
MHPGESVQDRTESRLDRIRGSAPPRRHDARTIAALTRNPGCARRGVLDAAGVDKDLLARQVGFPAAFGQSRFAIVRGNVFEARVKADGCADLLRMFHECLGSEPGGTEPGGTAAGEPLLVTGDAEPDETLAARHERTVAALRTASGTDRPVLITHPLLRLAVGGQDVHLEPDLVLVRPGGLFHVVEIKSFPVIDGQAEGEKVAAAAIQAAVYVLALRRLLGRPDAVSHDVVLVCPRDFSNAPMATRIDVRRQLLVLDHQLARLSAVDALVAALPPDLTFDLAPGPDGRPTRPAAELAAGLSRLDARYTPDCLSMCELAFRCRHEAAGRTAALGASVREELGGVETVTEVLELAAGTRAPTADQAEAADRLRTTARMYAAGLAAGPATEHAAGDRGPTP